MFKRNDMVVTCNYSEYHPEDAQFIMRGLDRDLSRKYGMCFNVIIEEGNSHKVEVTKNNILFTEKRIRAIRLKVFKLISSLNRS